MKVVLIDDEQAMHLIMNRMLAKAPDVEIVARFFETSEAFVYLTSHEVDLIFVDISMPRENGIEFAQRLRENGVETKLVFITSHKEFALHAFDVYAFDYMVKPVHQGRLYQTIQRALPQGERKSDSRELQFNCLGGLVVQNARGERLRWRSSKSAELFGYLLLHKGRPVSRLRLIEDIFGDLPQKNAEMYLNTTVYQLRKALDTIGAKESLRSDSSHYTLSLAHAQVDLLRFEEGCKRMTIMDNSNIEQAIELEQLYVGSLFGDRAFDWALNEAERVLRLYTSFTHRLCEALLDRNEANTAVPLLKKLISFNELEEPSMLLLLKALAIQKNKEALTRRFSNYKETLYRELGLSPSLEVVSLYEQLVTRLNG